MGIWLYSSGDAEQNAVADRHLVAAIGRRNVQVSFIPTEPDDAAHYYGEFVERFSGHGLRNFSMIPLEEPLSKRDRRRIMGAGLVYLSGGNTFYLAKWLRISGLDVELRRFLERGGQLAGHSAGAIVMTPSIRTASFPEDDRDENHVGLTDLRGLKMAPFEIFPHYSSRLSVNVALKHASTRTGRPIYALPDGSCIQVDGSATCFYGPVWGFVKGIRCRIGW